MIQIHCRAHHDTRSELCPACTRIYAYAARKMEGCPLLNDRIFCSSCLVHCYAPHEREQIRTIMVYSGKRMLLYHPFVTVSHLAGRFRRRKDS